MIEMQKKNNLGKFVLKKTRLTATYTDKQKQIIINTTKDKTDTFLCVTVHSIKHGRASEIH